MPGTFSWDDEKDPMDGFDTDPEPTPAPPPQPVAPRATPSLPKKPVAPQKPPQANVAQVIEDLENSPDPAELSEAEWRLEKAGHYRAIINSQLLASDHPAAVEVEEELQEWARGRLEHLLGLRKDFDTPATPPIAAYESPFTEEETSVLKQLVAKAMSRAAAASAPLAPPQALPATPAKPLAPVKQAVQAPKPHVAPVQSVGSSPRGRGRPRKHPCRFCGQMECEHKRKVNKPQEQQPQAGHQPPAQVAPTTGETYDGLPIQVMDDGTKFVETPDGRRYKLERRQVTHKQTGQVREAYVPVELSRKQESVTAKPYPSEQEVAQMAAIEAHRNTSAVASLTATSQAAGGMRITGRDLISAAMAAPEREEYIPTPPQK